MKYAILLLIAAAVQFPERTVAVDRLEVNRFGGGSLQMIAWERRKERDYPIDWTMNPRGTFDGEAWHDANGKTIVAREYVETVTVHDPERAAFWWWRGKGDCTKQGGVWK